jgi:hypothetical protein
VALFARHPQWFARMLAMHVEQARSSGAHSVPPQLRSVSGPHGQCGSAPR